MLQALNEGLRPDASPDGGMDGDLTGQTAENYSMLMRIMARFIER